MVIFKPRLFLFVFLFSLNAAAKKGEVVFFIFEEDFPKEKIKVVIDDRLTFHTNPDGIVEVDMEAGAHRASIHQSRHSVLPINFYVVANQTTTISHTLSDNSPVIKTESTGGEEKNPIPVKSQRTSTFKGNVKSLKENQGVSKVRVLVHGLGLETNTDRNGNFELQLPEGEHSMSFIHENYSTTTLKHLNFEKGQTLNESVTLKPTGLELEEFVVISPRFRSSVSALLEVRRKHQTVADIIGSEQIGKSGDSNAANSLRRVTGLSLIDGQFVYVRGLGERYSKALLNGADIPSPDPSRRVIPLDLFPSNVIENMIVQKGYSPEMPGEFGGGIIQIKTKTLPAKAYTKISISSNLDPEGLMRTYNGGSYDFLGIDSGQRSLPERIESKIRSNVNISGLTSSERKVLAQEINKSYNIREFEAKDRTSIPNFSISNGNRFKFGKLRVGYNVAALYSNNWLFDRESRTYYNQDSRGLVEDSNAESSQTQNRINLGGLLGLGVKYRKHKINYNGSILRNTLNLTRASEGIDSEREVYQKVEHGWRERSIESHQFNGENIFKFLNNGKLNYNYTDSKALLYEPDNKMYLYKKMDGLFRLETEDGSSSNNISWRYMPDRMKTFGLSYEQPFYAGVKLISGFNQTERYRQFSSRTFYFKFDENQTVDATQNPDTVFSHPSAELYQQANDTDNYSARQTLKGYFLNLKVPLWKFKLATGMRLEESEQEVRSFKLFNRGSTLSRIMTKDYLPVLSLTFNLLKNLQLRSNYSETISRPELREISNTTWNDVDENAKFRGNPRLKSAEIRNYGIRLGWFPYRGEVLSVGYFRKNFVNPIEAIFGSLKNDGTIVGTTDTQYTFLNIDSATSQGIELEFRKKLPFYLTLGGNYTWIQSGVHILQERAGQLTTLNRPLQGQSPYLINFQIDFEPERLTGTFTLLYNAIGRRITGVGSDGRPDEYQERRDSLDFVFSKKIYKNVNLRGRATNLLNPEIKNVQGNQITRNYQRGRIYTLGLSGNF